jgi:DNA polymerase-1
MKLKTTYVDALPKLINPKTGRIHTTFHQLGTATGRMSSSDPNLQNIPIRGELGKEIRRAFMPPKGFVFLSADYSQMELRVAAQVSQDEKMIEFFKEGKDIHRMTASQIFSVKEEEVTGDMRALAKTLNFGVLYGMGIRGFQEAAGVSSKEAKKFIEEYMQKFSGIARYVTNIKEEAKRLGYVETKMGRRRYIPEIHSLDPRLQRAGERIAINLPIQGFAADIIKIAMVETARLLAPFGDGVRLLLQVHDELLFEVKPELIDDVVPLIRRAMEQAYPLEVPTVAEFKSGLNWADLKKV